MKNKLGFLSLMGLVAALSVSVAIAADVELKDVMCVVAGKKPAGEGNSADWKEGKVYFCCANCPKAFAKDSKKFAASANMQLVATKQYEQKACPFSGGKLNPDTAIKVGEVKVSFCCNNRKGKAEKMEGADQVAALFGEEAFEKGKFEVVKSDK